MQEDMRYSPSWSGKAYLGDGVYLQQGVYQGEVVLTTENGLQETNRIVLEPEILQSLLDRLREMKVIK